MRCEKTAAASGRVPPPPIGASSTTRGSQERADVEGRSVPQYADEAFQSRTENEKRVFYEIRVIVIKAKQRVTAASATRWW
jgi:hypothetical protein